MEILGKTIDGTGYLVNLSSYEVQELQYLANEKNKEVNAHIRHEFFKCDCIGCAGCKSRGVCWSQQITTKLLKGCEGYI